MPHPRASIGMTLVEIMIACAVMATALFAGLGAISNAHLTSQRRQNMETALAGLQNQLEIFQALGYSELQERFSKSDVLFVDNIAAGEDGWDLSAVEDASSGGTSSTATLARRRSEALPPAIDPATGKPYPSAMRVERVSTIDGSVGRVCLRFVAAWIDQNGPAQIEHFFHYTERN